MHRPPASSQLRRASPKAGPRAAPGARISSGGVARAGVPVYLVEDNRLLREITAAMLAARGFTVAGSARNCEEALRELGRTRARVVLIDAELGDVAEAVVRLRETAPHTSVVVMNFPPNHRALMGLVRAGVAGFILKDATAEEIAGTVRLVATGGPALPRALGGRLLSHLAAQPRDAGRRAARDGVRLTRREGEVVSLLSDGLSNKEIADRLHMATHTVKSHVHAVLQKLGLRTRLEIAAYAHAKGR